MPPEPSVDTGALSQRQFPTARRGYDPGEVRLYLQQLGETIHALQQSEAEQRRRAEEAEARAERAEKPDHNQLVEMLGEETTRVLDAARAAAQDIRAKAEAAAERLISEANTRAHERVSEAEAETLARRTEAMAEVDELRQQAIEVVEERRTEGDEIVAAMRHEAEKAAATLRREAEEERARASADAETLHEAAREEAKRLVAEAETMRGRVLGDLGRRRRAAREQLERLHSARGRLLAAYEVVRRTVDEATSELDIALPEAKAASSAAGRRAQQEAEPSVSELESEVSMARIAGLLPPLPDNPELDAVLDGDADHGAHDTPGTSEPSEVEPFEVEPFEVEPSEIEPEVEPEDLGTPVPATQVTWSSDPEPDAQAEPTAPVPLSPSLFEVDAVSPLPEGAGFAEEDADVTGASEERDIAGDIDVTGDIKVTAEVDVSADAAADSETGHVNGVDAVDAVFARLKGGVSSTPSNEALLRQRDETLEPLERSLGRRLKRTLSNEQNELMDLIRRGQGGEDGQSLTDAAGDADRYADAAADELHTAAYWGAAAVEGQPASSCEDLIAELGQHLAVPLRERVAALVLEAGSESDELTDRVRSLYREWKGRRVNEAARHFVAAAYARGAYDAAPDDAAVRWVADCSAGSCPDAEDNARAGVLVKGATFPTGHCAPPAHPGCRCLVMPVATDVMVGSVGGAWSA